MSPYKIHMLLEIYALPMHADQHYVMRACLASAEGLKDLLSDGYIRHVDTLVINGSRFEVTPKGAELVRLLVEADTYPPTPSFPARIWARVRAYFDLRKTSAE